jgi:hypothetical protein
MTEINAKPTMYQGVEMRFVHQSIALSAWKARIHLTDDVFGSLKSRSDCVDRGAE